MHKRFAIITPTIGRPVLKRCVESVRGQVIYDCHHIVVGDGPQEAWVGDYVRSMGSLYYELPSRMRQSGTYCRNFALELIESTLSCDYVYFLDDDNMLFESAMHNVHHTANKHGNPPMLYHEICYNNVYFTKYFILPRNMPPVQGDWDGMNGIYRTDVIRGMRWEPVYSHDFLFAQEVIKRVGHSNFVQVEGIAGVHFTAWDTLNSPDGQKTI